MAKVLPRFWIVTLSPSQIQRETLAKLFLKSMTDAVFVIILLSRYGNPARPLRNESRSLRNLFPDGMRRPATPGTMHEKRIAHFQAYVT